MPTVRPVDDEFEPIEDRVPESLLKRLILDAAAQKYGTQYGRMRLRGQLTEPQFQACRWFDALYERYLAALERPRGIRTSTGEQFSKGHPPDPFSPIGMGIAEKEHALIKRYDGARMAGLACGQHKFKLFWYVVVDDVAPAGYGHAGLRAVAHVADAITAYQYRNVSKHKRGRR